MVIGEPDQGAGAQISAGLPSEETDWQRFQRVNNALTFHHTTPTIIYLDGKGRHFVLSDDEAPDVQSVREVTLIKALLSLAQSHFQPSPPPAVLYPSLGPGTLPY
jgi:2-oxo-4-hydroxy-4-carboxy--5-ureidoimidazoline (OHCU) decarboxylase